MVMLFCFMFYVQCSRTASFRSLPAAGRENILMLIRNVRLMNLLLSARLLGILPPMNRGLNDVAAATKKAFRFGKAFQFILYSISSPYCGATTMVIMVWIVIICFMLPKSEGFIFLIKENFVKINSCKQSCAMTFSSIY